mmetsp:Transcript_94515/g.291386  ORF Transcript_94515/g.291386 Transcript_94515/m.291386 type:complete len:373 (+) Transcript_94515:133-1251(+)
MGSSPVQNVFAEQSPEYPCARLTLPGAGQLAVVACRPLGPLGRLRRRRGHRRGSLPELRLLELQHVPRPLEPEPHARGPAAGAAQDLLHGALEAVPGRARQHHDPVPGRERVGRAQSAGDEPLPLLRCVGRLGGRVALKAQLSDGRADEPQPRGAPLLHLQPEVLDDGAEAALLRPDLRALLGLQLAAQALAPRLQLALRVAQLRLPHLQLALALGGGALGGRRPGLALLGHPQLLLELGLQLLGPALEREERALVLAEQRLRAAHQRPGQLQAPCGLDGVGLAHAVAHQLERRPAPLVLHGRDLRPRVLEGPVLQLRAVRRRHDPRARLQQCLQDRPGKRRALHRVGTGPSLIDEDEGTASRPSRAPENNP